MGPGKLMRNVAAVAWLMLILLGCASKLVLVPKSAVVPPGVDFSGQWLLREADRHFPDDPGVE